MATYEDSLKMFADGVKLSNRSMKSMTHLFDKLPKQINEMIKNVDGYTSSLDKLMSTQDKLNDSLKGATEGKGEKGKEKTQEKKETLGNKITKKFTDKAIDFGFNTIQNTLKAAIADQTMIDQFVAQTGNVELGTAMFEKFKADAIAAGQDANESLKSTLSFMPMVANMDQLDKLTKLSQQMSFFDTSGKGIDGAADVLKEVMAGKTDSLVSRFNISKSDIDALNITSFAATGDIDGFILAFDQLLEKANMGKEVFDTLLESPSKQIDILKNNLQFAFSNIMRGSLQVMAPYISKINEALQNGSLQSFFTTLQNTLEIVAEIFGKIAGVILFIAEIISANWTFFEPLIWGIVTALAAWYAISFIASIGTGGLTQAFEKLNLVMKQNKFVLIVAAIIGVIVWLHQLWKTNDTFVAAIMRSMNFILSIFDNILVAAHIVASVVVMSLLGLVAMIFLGFEAAFNFVISIINEIIKASNKFLGTNFEIIGSVDFTSGIADTIKQLNEVSDSELADLKKRKSENALAREQKVLDTLNNRALERQLEQKDKIDINYDFGAPENIPVNIPENISTIDKVNEVGKIRDTVDISSEDLKTMRDLAELKNIQNFVSLTPTVSVQTGDITQGGFDVDYFVNQITTSLERDIATSAEGVFR